MGFLVWIDLDDGFVYMAYFAIDARYRSHNYGSKASALIFNGVLKEKIGDMMSLAGSLSAEYAEFIKEQK